jgi:N-acetylmuramoyl-L-alanine amidase
MKAAKIERVRRRLLKEAVTDNLDTIRGLPPRSVRPLHRQSLLWLRRAPLLLIPLALAGSGYFNRNPVQANVATAAVRPIAASVLPETRSPAVKPAPRPPEEPLQRMRLAALPLSVRRVVLDAGHGGNDPGATNFDFTEKEVTLDIGQRLEALLEKNGFEVVQTRESDQTIPLRERARLANASSSDVFVSIHINTIAKHTTNHGVETYYLGPTNDPKLTELAAAENRGSGYSMADLRKLLDGIYADARRDESARLASIVQRELVGQLRRVEPELQDWGVKRAPFIVLVATDMPAVLAEVGCMSNPKEAKLLRQPRYRQQIAQALFEGIHAYASATDAPRKEGS